MMVMHCVHGNGTINVVSGVNVAEVSSGIYTVNGQERIRKSVNGYKNQHKMHKIMMGLIEKYGTFTYQDIVSVKDGNLWTSKANTKPLSTSNIKQAKW